MSESLLTDAYATRVGVLGLSWFGRPAFHADAACKEAPPGISWFPAAGHDARAAKAVCRGCLVGAECAAWAMAQGPDLEGIWGGLTRRERARLRG